VAAERDGLFGGDGRGEKRVLESPDLFGGFGRHAPGLRLARFLEAAAQLRLGIAEDRLERVGARRRIGHE
jgi:hypothetical protein